MDPKAAYSLAHFSANDPRKGTWKNLVSDIEDCARMFCLVFVHSQYLFVHGQYLFACSQYPFARGQYLFTHGYQLYASM